MRVHQHSVSYSVSTPLCPVTKLRLSIAIHKGQLIFCLLYQLISIKDSHTCRWLQKSLGGLEQSHSNQSNRCAKQTMFADLYWFKFIKINIFCKWFKMIKRNRWNTLHCVRGIMTKKKKKEKRNNKNSLIELVYPFTKI